MADPKCFLIQIAANLRLMSVQLDRLDGSLVEKDIAARRIEANIGHAFALAVDRIEAALTTTGSNHRLDQWVKQTCKCDIGTMRRRKRLHKQWREYETKRRKIGQCGQSGLLFALSLVSDEANAYRNNRSYRTTVRSAAKTISRPSKRPPIKAKDKAELPCEFITGDSRIELPKLKAASVNCIVTSPPYWPAQRSYGGKGIIGFEKDVTEYLGHLAAILTEAKRVLRDDGLLWINIGDSYLNNNLLFIPTRLAPLMQADGWVCRSEIVWQKLNVRPESVKDRPSRDYEKVLMFTKQRNRYFYNPDPIRIPLIKPGVIPRLKLLGSHDYPGGSKIKRAWDNPMGRNAGSVWNIAPANHYHRGHTATMPEELVRRCLLVSCPEDSLVLDPFGGAGTTALVATSLGHRTISIDINPAHSKEARQRLEAA